jgi:hypothetical protein
VRPHNGRDVEAALQRLALDVAHEVSLARVERGHEELRLHHALARGLENPLEAVALVARNENGLADLEPALPAPVGQLLLHINRMRVGGQDALHVLVVLVGDHVEIVALLDVVLAQLAPTCAARSASEKLGRASQGRAD